MTRERERMSIPLPTAYADFLRTDTSIPAHDYDGAPIVLAPIPEAELTLNAVWAQVDGTELQDDDPHDCEGAYRVEIVSLVPCDALFQNGYGALVWIPGEGSIGAYDTEHAWLYVFRDTPWETLRADIDTYLAVLNGEESPNVVLLSPWHRCPWTSWDDIEANDNR